MAVVSNIIAATELAIGRNPSVTWFDLLDEMLYTPTTGTGGANIGLGIPDAVSVYIVASPRHVAGSKSAYLTIARSVYDSSADYVAVVNGTSYTTTGESTAQLAVADLVSQINTAAVGNIRAVAVARGTDGVLDTVRVYETDTTSATATVTINFTTTNSAGATAIEGYVDAESCKIRLWVQMASPTTLPIQVPWVMPQNGDVGAVPFEGLTERLNVAGYSRFYIEAYDVVKASGDGSGVTARPFIAVAPAISED